MQMPRVLVTGSCGLIGSEIAIFLANKGFEVIGIDSNHRAVFFGAEGDTSASLTRLRKEISRYQHESIDIRDRDKVLGLVEKVRPNLIVHTAAQPSHDQGSSDSLSRFRSQRAGDAAPFGSGAALVCRISVHIYFD